MSIVRYSFKTFYEGLPSPPSRTDLSSTVIFRGGDPSAADKENRARFRESNYRGVAGNMFNIFMAAEIPNRWKKHRQPVGRGRYNVQANEITRFHTMYYTVRAADSSNISTTPRPPHHLPLSLSLVFFPVSRYTRLQDEATVFSSGNTIASVTNNS